MKKTFLSLTFMFVLMFLVACEMGTTKATLTLDVDSVDMYVGDTYEIEAVLENANNEIIYEVIEGMDIVSLEGKVVTGLAEGTAKIKIGAHQPK